MLLLHTSYTGTYAKMNQITVIVIWIKGRGHDYKVLELVPNPTVFIQKKIKFKPTVINFY